MTSQEVYVLAILGLIVFLQFLLFFLGLLVNKKPQLHDLQALVQESTERLQRDFKDEMFTNRREIGESVARSVSDLNLAIEQRQLALISQSESLRKAVDNQLIQASHDSRDGRTEQSENLRLFREQISTQLHQLMQRQTEGLEALRSTIDNRLKEIQADNSKKLEDIRITVDEKLHNTLELRLGESFRLVSERLELVHKGLGEMQSLATGVGDLKRVLANVKVRGIWGEVQLENLLEQILSPEQYAKNVATRPSGNERVEFAIKLPGKNLDPQPVWLPVDAKFPLEDYQRLLEAQEAGDLIGIEEAGKALETRIKLEARSIKDKYLEPPFTTDFGLLFLPIDGLYAEIIRRPGLFDYIQREYRVTVTGPTTLCAILSSLHMGFRTLAIEKRSGEVWQVLASVKSEFIKFGEILSKTRKKLDEARNTIDLAETRSRAIDRSLRTIETLPTTGHQEESKEHD